MRIVRLLLMLSGFLILTVSLTTRSEAAADLNGLSGIARQSGIEIGSMIEITPLKGDPDYQPPIFENFDFMVTNNIFKFNRLHPEPGVYDFTKTDQMVDFAEQNGLKIRGHTLIYWKADADWVNNGNYTREELIDILEDHVTTVVSRYQGRVFAWDVVNEAFSNDGTYRPNVWYQVIGPEYIEIAMEAARAADPDALLIYNDVGAEGLSTKSGVVYSMAQDFVARGVPLDGIGLQFHVRADYYPTNPDPEKVGSNMQRLADLGLKVHITEMDVRVYFVDGTVEEKWDLQAKVYSDIIEQCVMQVACDLVNFWGFTDRHSWIYNAFTGEYPEESPHILDFDYNEKPAYNALHALFTQAITPELTYFSLDGNGVISGIQFGKEDVLVYDREARTFEMVLDGSDVGLSGADVDALEVLPDGSYILSFKNNVSSLPGISTVVDPSDLVQFVPTSTGDNTAGTFFLVFDGEDVGMSTGNENIDAFTITGPSTGWFSTTGNHSLPGGISGGDTDLISFTATQIGQSTDGDWTAVFDGSALELSNNSEDVNGVHRIGSSIYLSTEGDYSVPNIEMGDGNDVFLCMTGEETLPVANCTYNQSVVANGSRFSDALQIDAFSLQSAASSVAQNSWVEMLREMRE